MQLVQEEKPLMLRIKPNSIFMQQVSYDTTLQQGATDNSAGEGGVSVFVFPFFIIISMLLL